MNSTAATKATDNMPLPMTAAENQTLFSMV
jgi:hypothetical protein